VEGLVLEGYKVLGFGGVSPANFPVIDDLVDCVPWVRVIDDRGRRWGCSTGKAVTVVWVVDLESSAIHEKRGEFSCGRAAQVL
jgi:hypothetical protein